MIPSDRTLAMAELKADAVFGKIPQDRYGYYISSSLQAGAEAVKELVGLAPYQVATELNATIITHEETAKVGGVLLRAQTISEKNGKIEIHIYTSSMESLVENSNWDGEQCLNSETALNAHLYHELFHAWEARCGGYVSEKLDKVQTWRFFSKRGYSTVTRCSEIAAHSFAKEMLTLPCLPNFYDYIYLLNTKKLDRDQFDDFFARMRLLAGE